MLRDLILLVVVAVAAGVSVAAYGSTRLRSCETRAALCTAQLVRSGATVADLSRQMKEHCQ